MVHETVTAQKDAVIAEYHALRDEIVARIRLQGHTLGWMIALVGASVGALFTLGTEGESSLAVTLLKQPSDEALQVFSVITVGFVLGIELLLTYWVYQLFMVFRMSKYLLRINKRLCDILGLPQDKMLFGWDQESKGLPDAAEERHGLFVDATLKLSCWAQPCALFALVVLGLAGLGLSLWIIESPGLVLSTSLLLLSVGLVMLFLMFLGLHRWVIGGGTLPHAALRRRRSERRTERMNSQEMDQPNPNKDAEPQESQQRHDVVLREVYEHLRWVRDEQSAFHRDFLGKVQRLMTAQALLFGGMGFSVAYTDWAWKQGTALTILLVLGVLAAILLVMGFLCGVRCLRVSDVPVVGIKVLADTVKGGGIGKLRPGDLHSDLSQNLARAITEERDRVLGYRKYGRLLNWTTALGTVLVALFVGSVLVGKAYFSTDGAG